eukprot:769438_1
MITPKFRTTKRQRSKTSVLPNTNEEALSGSSFDALATINFKSDIFGSRLFSSRSSTAFPIGGENDGTTIDECTIISAIMEHPLDVQRYANFRLKQALGLHQLNDSFNKLNFINSFIFRDYFKTFGIFITSLQCTLVFMETVSVWKWQHSLPTSHAISVFTSCIIELCVIMFHSLTIFAYFYRAHNIQSVEWIWKCIALVTFGCIISIECSMFCETYVRFHRMLRPLFFVLYWMRGLWCLEIIAITVAAIIKPFMIAIVSITIFSFVVYSMFCEEALRFNSNSDMQGLAGQLEQFSSLSRTWVEMFVLQTTATYPDVMAKIYKVNPNYCFIFIIYLIVQFLLITNLFLCVVCEINKKVFGAKITQRFNATNDLLKEVWLLATNTHYDDIDFHDTKQLQNTGDSRRQMNKLDYLQLLHLCNDYGKGTLTDLKKEIIWNALSRYNTETRQRYVEQQQFIRDMTCYLGARIVMDEVYNTHKFISLCQSIVKYKICSIEIFAFIFDVITILQCVMTFMRLASARNPHLSIMLIALDYVWIVEMCIRLLGTSWREYCGSRHVLNGMITVIAIGLSVLEITHAQTVAFERLDDSIELLRLFTVIGFIIKYGFETNIWPVVTAMIYSLRSSAPILIHLMLSMYSFAVLGMDLFGTINFDEIAKEKQQTDHYIWGSSLIEDEHFQSFNFDCFSNAMHQSFIALIANNWHVFMFGYAQIFSQESGDHSWQSLIPYAYFITVMIAIPSILLQLLCAVLLDIFDGYSYQRQNNNKINDIAQRKLQDAANELYPNKYKVQCFDIRCNDFYELPQKHADGIKYWIS